MGDPDFRSVILRHMMKKVERQQPRDDTDRVLAYIRRGTGVASELMGPMIIIGGFIYGSIACFVIFTVIDIRPPLSLALALVALYYAMSARASRKQVVHYAGLRSRMDQWTRTEKKRAKEDGYATAEGMERYVQVLRGSRVIAWMCVWSIVALWHYVERMSLEDIVE